MISVYSFGQNYTVASSSSSYTNIFGGQTLTTTAWDDPDFYIVPGFAVTINGNAYDSLLLNDLGCTITGVKNGIENLDAVNPSIIDVIDRGYDAGATQSSISYKVEGFAGNRILKLQWNNVGSYGDYDAGGNSMSINFQLWFYEQGHYIEVRYGSSNISDINVFYEGEIGAGVTVLADLYSSSPNDVFLTGATNFPTVTNLYSRMNGTPANGQMYRLTPALSVGVEETTQRKISIYPNPSTDIINFTEIDAKEYMIFSADGKMIDSGVLMTQKEINISQLAQGNYLLKLTNWDGEQFHQVFIKQ